MTMTKKLAAALFAATMLVTPAFAADSAGSAGKPAQTQTSVKADNTSDKAPVKTTNAGVKKHRVHASVKHHRHVAKHAKPAAAKATAVKPSGATTTGVGTSEKQPAKN